MPLLTETKWKFRYSHEDGDLVELFYNPALACAVEYCRTTGYFSADALALAARGLAGLFANEGRMRLVVGCTLDPDERDAIEAGYDLRDQMEQRLAAADLTPPDEHARQGLELLAWMVANGYLDVKVAVPVDAEGRPARVPGIYHAKFGIIADAEGNTLTFSGSINETAGGWKNNCESFHVHCAWLSDTEKAHADEELEAFAKLWENRSPGARVFDFPEAARKKLLEYLPKEDRPVTPPLPPRRQEEAALAYRLTDEEFRRCVWTFVKVAPELPHGIRMGEVTSAVSPWPHQVRTYVRFLQQWPCRLLIADEVGLGKTITAGLILRQALLSGKAKRILILTPKSVQIQWQNELYEKFNLNVPIYDGATLRWRPAYGWSGPLERAVGRDAWQKEPVVLASSFLMRRKDRVRELLEAEPWDLVLLDEAHHARRRGAGTEQEKGPNALLSVMRELARRCQSLLLLTATPMQVHPVEIWDLMDLLGLPPKWAAEPHAFLKYFSWASGNPSPETLDLLTAWFRDCEAYFGPLTDDEIAALTPGISSIKRTKVMRALRDTAQAPRRMLDPESRRALLDVLKACSPLRWRMVRHTRELLRSYRRAGKLDLPIAERDVKDIPVEMTAAESALYAQVEDYISETYSKAASDKRTAIGFVMTVYRRRLASSFEALKRTLNARLEKLGLSEEDVSLDEAADEVMAPEEAAELAASAAELEERDRILNLLRAIAKLNTDTKARRLHAELVSVFTSDSESAIVFTQYTDTMEYLRDFLAREMPDVPVASYSGSGGAWRDGSGRWITCSKEEIKRRLKTGRVRLLVCSDAAGEGLNLQAAGVLANYDLPWNPMKVEQRIGRIDRLGQQRPQVKILNFAYKDTVEADVYFAVGERIQLFQGIVGRLQPILSKLPRRFEEVTLTSREAREAARQRFLAEIEQEVTSAAEAPLDLDIVAREDLAVPPLPEPPYDLAKLDHLMGLDTSHPVGLEWRPLDVRTYAARLPGMQEPVRVTTAAEVFEECGDSHQFFSPGGPLFEEVQRAAAGALSKEPQPGICWLLRDQSGKPATFVVNTAAGFCRADTLDALMVLLERPGVPAPFPEGDWPGYEAFLIS
ncbi:MAG TPA: SNF2-related protein [Bryobacteraceae bacterium]|nr:SNF2-related protein [Bryobacteraceae bacterium]HPU74377.1 SNF2-related protein [Bryobacteraceae bacterium]